MKLLDLFSGIGGFSLGLERAGFQTVAFCEIDPFCRAVLKKHWPEVPCYEDIRTLTAERLAADGIAVDVICGGFPCQDISSAGRKVGIGGERSGLWSHYARLIRELRPRFVIVENVSALLSRGLDVILGDLAGMRYDAEWFRLSASDIGAPHGRRRQWIIAYPNNESQSASPINDEACGMSPHDVAIHAERGFSEVAIYLARIGRIGKSLAWDGVWPGEDSPLGMGVDDGVPQRLDRLKGLGNSVMPKIPELIGKAIIDSVDKNSGQ